MTRQDRSLIARLRKQVQTLTTQAKNNRTWGTHKYTGYGETIRKMRAVGMSDRLIASHIGCSKSTANRMRHDYGYHATLYDRRWR